MRINLHSHTNYSADGKLSVKEILEKAEAEKLDIFSITDHNLVKAYEDPDYNKYYTGKMLVGTELCVMIGEQAIDLTCYYFDFAMVKAFIENSYLDTARTQRQMYKWLVELCNKNNIKLASSVEMPDGLYAHRYIYDLVPKDLALFEQYQIKTGDDFFRVSVMDKDFPLYINMASLWPTLEEATRVVKEAGGLVFFAHPYDYTGLDVLEMLERLKDLVDGIEVANAKTTPEQIKYLFDFAKQHHLLMSVGTDFHGTPGREKFVNEPNPELIIELKKWIR